MQSKPVVYFRYLPDADYYQTWNLQEQLLQEIVQIKLQNKNKQTPTATPNYLLFCEHPHVYTLGKNGKKEHLLLSENELERIGATFVPINRGGDITYHGKGQLVGYPILNLDHFSTDLHAYMRNLEEVIIQTLQEYTIRGYRIPKLTGVWVDVQGQPKKIAAFGVRCSHWVTMHGFAFNINTDLKYFEYIIPCGIQDKGVTSLAEVLQTSVDEVHVRNLVLQKFEQVFDCIIKYW
ncbi:MAG: lipoyl(octanoyl) transferase LipB [Bacteroidia bacterium]|nr:lipoyl(octanoyl) transferase LipB [Bacteroidia bacterium]MDW8347520.1 lipoyl(octanoyl) transferase LipB [Bacteroidia bacterium]